MAKNARQRRAAKRNLALGMLARVNNPSTQPAEGNVRAVWTKTMPGHAARINFVRLTEAPSSKLRTPKYRPEWSH